MALIQTLYWSDEHDSSQRLILCFDDCSGEWRLTCQPRIPICVQLGYDLVNAKEGHIFIPNNLVTDLIIFVLCHPSISMLIKFKNVGDTLLASNLIQSSVSQTAATMPCICPSLLNSELILFQCICI